MRHILFFAALALSLVGCQSNGKTTAHEMAAPDHVTITPDQVKWSANPASLPPGAKLAVLEGDPTKAGFFTMRATFPDGYRIPPHWHPTAERVTILSGTLYLGHGDQINEANATALPAGAYSSMPALMHHFAYTKGETIIQVSGNGPWGITYINPTDDPRNAKK